jgi:hypothetical protein
MTREQALADAIEEAAESDAFMVVVRRLNEARVKAGLKVLQEAFQDGTMSGEALDRFVTLLEANFAFMEKTEGEEE